MNPEKRLSEFTNDYLLITDSQEVAAILDYFGVDNSDYSVTATVTKMEDGEYFDTWISCDNAPWKLNSGYEPLADYLHIGYAVAEDYSGSKFLFGSME